jgi:hypothetical protein
MQLQVLTIVTTNDVPTLFYLTIVIPLVKVCLFVVLIFCAQLCDFGLVCLPLPLEHIVHFIEPIKDRIRKGFILVE